MYPYDYKTTYKGIKHKEIFVLMPFESEYDDIFNVLINNAVESANRELGFVEEYQKLRPFRTKEDIRTTSGWLNVLEHLMSAQINLAVLEGNNTNVFYELGIAHATQPVGRQLLIASNNYEPMFDTKDLIYCQYDRSNLSKSIPELTKWIVHVIKNYSIENERIIKKAKMLLGIYDFEVIFCRGADGHFGFHSNKPDWTEAYELNNGRGSFERHVIGIKNLCLAGLLGLNTKSTKNEFGKLSVEFSYYWTGLGNDVLLEMEIIDKSIFDERIRQLPNFFEG